MAPAARRGGLPLLLPLLLLTHVAAYPYGWSSSCIDDPNGHGSPELSSPSALSLTVRDAVTSAVVTSYVPGTTYTVDLARSSGTFRGWLAGVYSGPFTSMAAARAGVLSGTSSNTQSAGGCSGTVTQTGSTARTTVRWSWASPVGGGDVTLAAVVVVSYSSGWTRVTHSLPAAAAASPTASATPTPLAMTATGTPSPSTSATSTQSLGASPSPSRSPSAAASSSSTPTQSGTSSPGCPPPLVRAALGAPCGLPAASLELHLRLLLGGLSAEDCADVEAVALAVAGDVAAIVGGAMASASATPAAAPPAAAPSASAAAAPSSSNTPPSGAPGDTEEE